MQSHEGIRTVLAASSRLWALAEQTEDTSPFLHGFTPPVYLGPLADDEAADLLLQTNLDPGKRQTFSEEAVDRLRELTGNHPYLLQVLATRFLELGDTTAAVADAAADATLGHLFAVDLSLLSNDDVLLLRSLADDRKLPPPPGPSLAGPSHQLVRLGLVRRTSNGQLTLGNHLLKLWLASTTPV